MLILLCNYMQTNTFQCILITDGTHSFVIFLYADDLIQWSRGSISTVDAQAGFNAGDGIRHFTVEGSQTPAIVNIETTSNVGVPGKYVFCVDNMTISDPLPGLLFPDYTLLIHCFSFYSRC